MKNNFSLAITGEWPGAGQTTTATLLASMLDFEKVYAGHLFRKFAHIWQSEMHRYSWEEFESKFKSNQIKLEDYQFQESDFNEATLHQWQKQLKSSGTPDMWDKILERQSLIALQKPHVIVEAKVGVLLDKTKLLKPKPIDHKIYKFLLTCPPEISAHRVIKRKIQNKELPNMDTKGEAYSQLVRDTTNEIIKRHLRDWERYEKIYGIKRSDIYKPNIIKVKTENKNPNQVAKSIISILNQDQSS